MILNKHFLGTFFRREDPESPYYNLINAVHEKMVDIDRNTSHKEKFDQIIATIILDDAWSSGNSALRLTVEYMPDTYSVLVNLHNAEDRLVYAAKTRKNEWIAPLNESLKVQLRLYAPKPASPASAPKPTSPMPDNYGDW